LIRFIAHRKKKTLIATVSTYSLGVYLLFATIDIVVSFLFAAWIATQVYLFKLDVLCKDSNLYQSNL
jgi:hypothetical protein